VQESLTNIVRHARAKQASVELSHQVHADGTAQVRLAVRDNGVGLRMADAKPGMGMLGMRERISALGGQLEWTSLPTGGTQLQLHLSLPHPELTP